MTETPGSSDYVISTVNLSGRVTIFVDHGIPDDDITALTAGLEPAVTNHEAALTQKTGRLHRATRAHGLSSRACLAFAQRSNAAALTTGYTWAELDQGVAVECIRP